MQDLKSILEKVLGSTPNYKANADRIAVVELWPTIVGPTVAQHCRAVALLRDGAVLVEADSNAWLQSIRYLEKQIVEKYEAALKKKGHVTGVHLKLAGRSSETPRPRFKSR